MNENGNNKKLDWMYKGANSLVDREEYLLGRSVDKALEQLNAEEKEKKLGLVPPKNHVEHECIPPSIRDFNKIVQAEQVDISAKLQEDPLVAIKKREEEARRQFLQNPVQLKKLQEALQAQQLKKKKKKHKKVTNSDSDSDIDSKIVKKLKYLKEDSLPGSASKKQKRKSKDSILDTILMHKFNQLKDKLSQEDLNDILAGNASDSDKEKKSKKFKNKKESDSEERSRERKPKGRVRSSSTSSEDEKPIKVKNVGKQDKGYLNSKYNSRFDKSRKYDGDLDRKQTEVKSKTFRKHESYKKHRKSTSTERSQVKDSSSSDEEVEGRKNKHDKKLSEKIKTCSESLSKDNRKRSLDRQENENKYVYEQKDPESDLERQILQKLRMLRDSAQSKGNESSSDSDNTESEKNYRTKTANVKSKSRDKSSSDSSSSSSDSEKHSRKTFRQYDSESDEDKKKPKTFGLVKSDGTKLALNRKPYETNSTRKSSAKADTVSKPERKNVNKLSEEEKEKLRREMMRNAKVRDKERSDNLRRYREEDEREKKESGNFDKGFVHKELLKSTKDATIETRIKSNLNNIQRSSRHMDSNFSRKK